MGRAVVVFLVGLALVLPLPAGSQESEPAPEETGGAGTEAEAEEKTGKKKARKALPTGLTEEIVVSASATSDRVIDAPAAVDILPGEELEARPADHIADQLRRVPGINVVQFSARDVNIASRGATGGINNSTLAISDGRTLYQDFLGFVMWEFAPADAALVERIEVVRGPASSLWGANAVGGLVHVITRSPRDTLGGRLTVGAGTYDAVRVDVNQSFLAGPWAMRVSAGYYESDAFPRPETIENFWGDEIDPDLGLLSEDFRDSGTRQPRVDLRADWEGPSGGEWILQGGWGRTRGWIATGLGPFDVDPSTALSYAQARYRRNGYEAQVDFNHFDGRGRNLINAILFDFTSAASHASVRGRTIFGERGVLGWGAEGRLSSYDLSIAPRAERRTQAAAFAEADVKLLRPLRLVLGARADYVKETIGAVVSPRASLLYQPHRDHTVRAAWGRAFRSPSVVESDLSVPTIPVAILEWAEIDRDQVGFPFFEPVTEIICSMQPDNCGVAPGEVPDYIAVTAAEGSRDLEEEQTTSIELGYAGRFGAKGRFGLQATVYRTRSKQGIDFPQMGSYGFGPDGEPGTDDDIVFPTDPDGDGIDEAPATDVCPLVNALPPFRDLCPQGPVPYNQFLSIMLDGLVPSLFRYNNGSAQENLGIELGFDWVGPVGLLVYANYSWQDDPEVGGRAMTERVETTVLERQRDRDLDGDGLVADTADFVNIPAEHRVSAGVSIDRRRWFASLSVDYLDRTFWQDVLTSDFWGYVPSYTLVGLHGGWRWPRRGLELDLQATNLLDDNIQQHIYGDIIGRRISAGLTYRWGPDGRPATARPGN